MQAAWYESNGEAADVLQLGGIPPPEPSEGEVRVRLATSGINPVAIKRRRGARVEVTASQYSRTLDLRSQTTCSPGRWSHSATLPTDSRAELPCEYQVFVIDQASPGLFDVAQVYIGDPKPPPR